MVEQYVLGVFGQPGCESVVFSFSLCRQDSAQSSIRRQSHISELLIPYDTRET